MKRNIFSGMAAILVMSVAALTSCDKQEQKDVNTEQHKEYIVSLGYSGEIGEITDSPLTRAEEAETPAVPENKDLYGIQVYSSKMDQNAYSYYGYGLFDQTGNINVKLLGDYKYKFVATAAIDAKDRIYSSSNGEFTTYGSPFGTSGTKGDNTPLNNDFNYSAVTYMNLDGGYTYLPYSGSYYRPNMDRYYGETEGYVPQENGTVTIFMKRTVFGAKFVAKGLQEGSVRIKMQYCPDMEIVAPNTSVMDIFSFSNVGEAFRAETLYSENVNVTVVYVDKAGKETPIGSKTIAFKRNKLTTVNLILEQDPNRPSGMSNIILKFETEEMTDGDNIDLNQGDGLDQK